MKHWKFFTVCFLVMVVASFNMVSAEMFYVTLSKAGQLSKKIKKGEVPNVISLEIEGPINNVDLGYIQTMENLEFLDLSKADISAEKYDPNKLNFYYDHKLKLPNLPKLKTFVSSPNCHKLENIANLSSLKNLGFFRKIDQDDLLPSGISLSLDTLALYGNYQSDPDEVVDNFADSYGRYINRLESPIKVKLLYTGLGYGKYRYDSQLTHKGILPNIIKTPYNTILYHWSPDLTDADLEDVDIISPYAFYNADIEELSIPSKVRKLPSYFALYSNINKIDLNNIEDIDKSAFYGSKITSVKLPSTLKSIHSYAFYESYVNKAAFTSKHPPVVYYYNQYGHREDSDVSMSGTTIYVVPKGKLEDFKIGSWAKEALVEEGTQIGYEFDIATPGTLKDFITDEIASNVFYLTISGVIDDTDFEAIRKCRSLRYLDLRKCFTLISLETLRKERGSQMAVLKALGVVFDEAANTSRKNYENGTESLDKVVYTNAVNELYKDALNQVVDKPIETKLECTLPRGAFDKLYKLQFLAYPSQIKYLVGGGNIESSYIEEVILPSNLIKLGVAIGGPHLSSIKFPSTLKEIKGNVFTGCTNLREIDLRSTQVESINWVAFYGCTNLTKFYASPSLKKIYEGDTWGVTSKRIKIKEGWFYTKEKPEGIKHLFETIHIPVGCSAGYSGLLGTKVIDDIPD